MQEGKAEPIPEKLKPMPVPELIMSESEKKEENMYKPEEMMPMKDMKKEEEEEK